MRTVRFLRSAALAMVLLPVVSSAQSALVGDWKAVFVGPIGDRPKMVDEITFSIRSAPAGLIGTGRASEWPGDLVLSDVKLEGNRLSFTATGKKGWATSAPGGGMQEYCCPKLMFTGTVDADAMKLSMTWQATDRPDDPNARRVPMEAKRLSKGPAR